MKAWDADATVFLGVDFGSSVSMKVENLMSDEIIRADCPMCGAVYWWYEDYLCDSCGRGLCLVYRDRREYMGDRISRATWYRIVMDIARAYWLPTPAIARWMPRANVVRMFNMRLGNGGAK
jgi:hypothetical protein